MNLTAKTVAIASVITAISAPAFAGGHMSTSMTCADWKALGADDQMKVAQMALSEINSGDDGASMQGSATATTMGEGVSAAAATDADNGAAQPAEATATQSPLTADVNAFDDNDLAQFMRVCDRNLDAMVSEAAAGMAGTR